ncbi:MAG: MBL fold metallo-hydrolase [Christensenellales bacterium]|jgi:hydroxyacylglutathione hydrolase
MLQVQTAAVGPIQANCYIVYQKDQAECVLIDPGGDADQLTSLLDKLGVSPTYILLTHGHFDHLGAVAQLAERYGAKVAIHEAEAHALTNGRASLADIAGVRQKKGKAADRLLQDGDVMDTAGMRIEVLHTPGHSKGSVCYLIEDCMFSGDTLFRSTIGRTDLPGSDQGEMAESLSKIRALGKDYRVFPGHMEPSMLSEEINSNPYLKGR